MNAARDFPRTECRLIEVENLNRQLSKDKASLKKCSAGSLASNPLANRGVPVVTGSSLDVAWLMRSWTAVEKS